MIGETMRCKITGISHNGEGVGRLDGKAVFIRGAIPGETVDCEPVHENRSLIRASLTEIMEPSPDRVAPKCPYYEKCEGCAYQHMNYGAQMVYKGQVIGQQLKRIGGWDGVIQPMIESAQPEEYRNKVEWQLFLNESGGASLGYMNLENRGPVQINHCLLLKEPISELSMALHQQAGLLFMMGVRRVGIRYSDYEKSLMLNLFSANPIPPSSILKPLQAEMEKVASLNLISFKGIKTVKGNPFITEKVAGLEIKISALSFFQVNRLQAEKLFRLVADLAALQGGETVVDAYCGTGVMAMVLARQASKVIGIDNYPDAIEDARENCERNGFANCRFVSGNCEDALPGLQEKCDVLILDPPRSGCKPQVLKGVEQLNPTRIVYVSCNPATLARDLKILAVSGYLVKEVQPLDMFPQTWHVECVVVLEKNN